MVRLLYFFSERVKPSHLKNPGFTLAELLIALAVLGVIATFTIPKILLSQQDQRFNAIGKEDFSAVSSAYSLFMGDKTPTSNTVITEITPYINYITIDTSSTLDGSLNDGASYSCATGYTCLKMHNGSMIALSQLTTFGGTSSTNMTWFLVDPDGSYTGNTKSVWGALYFNARVTSWGKITPGSVTSSGTWNPGNYDPSWFNW